MPVSPDMCARELPRGIRNTTLIREVSITESVAKNLPWASHVIFLRE
jgi:hypothetical protein